MRELAFRASVALGSLPDTRRAFRTQAQADDMLPLTQQFAQTVQVRGKTTRIVYDISIGYLLAATLVSLLPVPSLFLLFWGWWELGRPVSLSPLETAKMFDPRL